MELVRTVYTTLNDYLFVICDSLFQSNANHILEDVIEYVVEISESDGVPSIRNPSRQPSGFTEDIGQAVLILIYANRYKQEFQHHMKAILLTCGHIFHEEAAGNYVGNEVLNYGRCMETGVPRDCLAYFAVICELIVRLNAQEQSYLRKRILIDAEQCLNKYAEVSEDYRHLDSFAKELMEVFDITRESRTT